MYDLLLHFAYFGFEKKKEQRLFQSKQDVYHSASFV